MRWTNDSFLPPHLFAVLKAAWEQDVYDGPRGEKTLSVTQLISPPQKLALERVHAEELEMDVLDTVPALLGQALHHILERAGTAAPTHVPERRLATVYDGWIISGKTDLYETKEQEIVDYKNSSVWTYVFGKIEWEQQLNIYRWLSERNGHPVRKLSIGLFCGDWRRSEARRSPDYPARVVSIPIKLWTMDEAEAYVDARLKLHQAAAEGKTVECSAEERWVKPTKYALMKHGRKTAIALSDAKPAECPAGHYIETRQGESVRCKDYCSAAPFCPQWKADPTNPENEQTLEIAPV
jgi:hypothetical protein